MSLGVLVEAESELLANGPLFLVPKPGQPGEWQCLSDMKRGGQNNCIGKDPTFFATIGRYLATFVSWWVVSGRGRIQTFL
jgi:hypothetical protein